MELAFSHCGRWLAACGFSGGLHVWDTSNPTAPPRHAEFPGSYLRPGSLSFRADGRVFVNNYSGNWFLYDPATGKVTALKGSRANWVVPSPDGRRVVRIGEWSPLRTWTISAKDKVGPMVNVRVDGRHIEAAAFTADGGTFATAEHHNSGARWVPELRLRDAETANPTRELVGAFRNTAQMAFSKDGAHLIARANASLACWTIAEPTRAPRKATNPSRRHFLSMAVHPSGPVLTVDNDRLVRVWDVPALTTDRIIEWNIGKLYAVAVSADGTRAAVGSHTGKVLAWDWD
jgi:WD40 repeat protein